MSDTPEASRQEMADAIKQLGWVQVTVNAHPPLWSKEGVTKLVTAEEAAAFVPVYDDQMNNIFTAGEERKLFKLEEAYNWGNTPEKQTISSSEVGSLESALGGQL